MTVVVRRPVIVHEARARRGVRGDDVVGGVLRLGQVVKGLGVTKTGRRAAW